ncbi:MAG: Asp-tRNA(Asn)/Glu-tRNA(Gln) amidotransferase subunit GatA, partial [Lachnospiraceae bacterium]|nr:Asp-tRNA(Asn)/Glu-tRNA(Gln) amidotransferase subunit GatA [Candidatus Hippenecus merdae]
MYSVKEAAALLDAGKITPVDLVEEAIAATEEFQPKVNAYITFTPEKALEDAKRAAEEIRKYGRKSMLHGIPFAVKDLIDAAGLPTTMG